MDKNEKTGVSRRDFFRTATLGSAAAAGAAIALGTDEAEAAETVTSPTAAGYRETALVKTYYDLARF
ncbi:MAG: formate dehydrogenase [Kiloniellales bacterium]|uniref:formate dehydrogenase n=1 Tax=Algihabitans albus TaxID=2164067 RepID=UPI000E5D2B60|nr:formate dehydrogenase [Algihabitans albus]